MNKENILKEGILEAYFLGELSASQEEEVSQILKNDRELFSHYKELERSMEKLAFENAVKPPKHIKEELIKKIGKTRDDSQSKVVGLQRTSYKSYFNVAASLTILFMTSSLILLINLNNAKQELLVTLNEQEILLDSLNRITKATTDKEELISFINDPKTNRHLLVGNQLASDAMVLSYINHNKKSVMLHIHNLPEITNKDYQMWADVNGEMIDMGVIDTSQKLLTMNYIENAESINITIEAKGGSDHPDVTNLISSATL